MINPATGCFEITQHKDKKVMTIENLVETMCMDRYPWPVDIMYG